MSDELTPTQEQAITPRQQQAIAEIRVLANRLAESYADSLKVYVREYKLTLEEAIAKQEDRSQEYLERLWETPSEQVHWFTLNDLQGRAPELAIQKWQQVKEDAREDLASGHYSFARILDHSPYEKAIYLAVRDAFSEQWKPQNAGEQILVDTLAQLYCQYLNWLHRLDVRTNLDRDLEDSNIQRTGKWKPSFDSHGTTPEWIETTSNMVERFHRLFLRTLRALRDLRRWNVNVVIPNAGQVNIGQQQVNTAQVERAESGDDE